MRNIKELGFDALIALKKHFKERITETMPKGGTPPNDKKFEIIQVYLTHIKEIDRTIDLKFEGINDD